MANAVEQGGLNIEVTYRKGEEAKVAKVREGASMIADALGLGPVDMKTYSYGSEILARITAGATAS